MRRKRLESIGLEPEEWVNEAGYRYRSRRGFDAAQEQIREERRVLEHPESYGPWGLGPALVATAVLIGWAVVAFLLFWFLAALLGF